jgi:alcohol dehydrogenase, propanol-preferring
MQAVRYVSPGHVEIAEVADPVQTVGHALVRVTAAGICQTDVHVRRAAQAMIPLGTVLGHEVAGDVVSVADDVTSVQVGQQVIVHPVWSCQRCRMCVSGKQNACLETGGRLFPASTPGVSVDGGLADLISVPASALVPADGIDPALAAILADAAIVPYHSIDETKHLLGPGSTAVIIGIGGLGQFAVQLLNELTSASIIALDINDASLEKVRDRVSHTFRSDSPTVVDDVLGHTGGYGADVVIDLVGNNATLELSASTVRPYGAIRVPGLSDGTFGFETSQVSTSLPWGASLTRPYSGTYQNLHDLVALARGGRLQANITRYSFNNAVQALDDLEAGNIIGRAVVVP